MTARSKQTWIIVLDAAQARIFALRPSDDGQVFEEITAPMMARHENLPRAVRIDKPKQALRGIRRPSDPRDSYFKLETAHFARQVASTLEAGLVDKRYNRLVLAGPPRMLAELRDFLTVRVRATLVHEIAKNLVHLDTGALWARLSVQLLKAARPLNGGPLREPVMLSGDFPVSIVFRNMDPSPAIQAAALRYAAKIGRKFGRIVNCRVTIDASHHVHRKAKLFGVSVDLKLPGRDIAGKSERSDYGTVNANVALRDAFSAASRQMQEHVGRMHMEAVRTKRRNSERRRTTA